MAHVYMASHLLLSPTFSVLSCCWLFICFLTSLNQVETLTYDCQSLLDSRSCCMVVSETNLGKFVDIPYRTIIRDFPDFLRRWPLDIIPRKHRRRRGKRGGLIIRVKSYLRAGIPPSLCPLPRTTDYCHFVFRHLPVQSSRWLRYTMPAPRGLPDSLGRPPLNLQPRICIRPRAVGVNHANLRSVSKTPVSRNTQRSPKNGADQRSFSG